MKSLYQWGRLSLGLLPFFALAGCTDLDTAPQGDTVTEAQKAELYRRVPERASAAVNGVMSIFSRLEATAKGHLDFGYGSVLLGFDCRGADVTCTTNGYNWFGAETTLDDNHVYDRFPRVVWSNCYDQIKACNALLASVKSDDTYPVTRFNRAQAQAVRAFDYFTLAQSFQFTYKGHEQANCVPVITEDNQAESEKKGLPLSSVEAVYQRINTDLDSALVNLQSTDTERSDRRFVSLAVVYGLRARVALVQQRWADAAAAADQAITAAAAEGITPASREAVSHPTFTSMSENDWMWGIKIEETDPVVTSGVVNWASHMCTFAYGYVMVGATKGINTKLYASIPSTDVRKGWFLDAKGESPNLNRAQRGYLAEIRATPFTNVKFDSYKSVPNQSISAQDLLLMRVEEMYLIKAEALAMSGQAAEGAKVLTDFVKTYRDPAYTLTATTPEAVQEAVWMQRRVELWGEGFSYFDLLRLGKGIDRRDCGFLQEVNYNVPANSPVMLIPVPQKEREANKAVKDSDYNPLGSKPQPVPLNN